jgi:hypothetical protein
MAIPAEYALAIAGLCVMIGSAQGYWAETEENTLQIRYSSCGEDRRHVAFPRPMLPMTGARVPV